MYQVNIELSATVMCIKKRSGRKIEGSLRKNIQSPWNKPIRKAAKARRKAMEQTSSICVLVK
jgi:hypothetical protein